MKIRYRVYVIICLAIIVAGCSGNRDSAESGQTGTITISGAWSLYPLAVKWAEEYMKINPGIRLEVSAGGAGKGMSDVLANMVDIGMISREINQAEIAKGVWWIPVAKDAVVVTINAENPYLAELLGGGMTRELLREIWIKNSMPTWESLLRKQGNSPLHVYTRSDACGAAQTWAAYMGGKQEDLAGVGVYGDPGLAEAVKQDRFGIGFNNINYAYDPAGGTVIRGLAVLPLDLDNNGRIEQAEDFYSLKTTLLEAIRRGDYPSPPARELYFSSNGKPAKPSVIAFIRWILTEGQRYIPEAGYIPVSPSELKQALSTLE